MLVLEITTRVDHMPSRQRSPDCVRLYVEDDGLDFEAVGRIIDFVSCGAGDFHVGICKSKDYICGHTISDRIPYVLIEFPAASDHLAVDWSSIAVRNPRSEDCPEVSDWKDALVWIFAHEVCHVFQVLSGSELDLENAELEAEIHALKTLDRWRRQRDTFFEAAMTPNA